MSIFSALAPYPAGPGGGAVFTFFILIFSLGALAGVQELLIAIRAAGLLVGVRRLESERIRSTRQLKDMAAALGAAHPALAPSMAQLVEVIYEQQGVVRLAAPPSELLAGVGLHRGPLPRALLQTTPMLLVVLGVCGSLAGLSIGLADAEHTGQVLNIALRSTTWGLLSAALLLGISRWSSGTVSAARDRLVGWLESQAGAGSSASGLIRLSRSQDQLRTMMEQTTGAIQDLLKIQKSVLENTPAPQGGTAPSDDLTAALTAALESSQREPDNAELYAKLDKIAERLMQPVESPVLVGALAGLRQQWKGIAAQLEKTTSPDTAAPAAWPALEEKLDLMVGEMRGLTTHLEKNAASAPTSAEPMAWPALEEKLDLMVSEMKGLTTHLKKNATSASSSTEPVVWPALEEKLDLMVGEMKGLTTHLEKNAASAPASAEPMAWPALEEKLDLVVGELRVLGTPITTAAADLSAAAGQLLEGTESSHARAAAALDRSTEALLAGADGYLKANDTLSAMLQEQQSSQRSLVDTMNGVGKLMTDLETITANVSQGASNMSTIIGPVSDSIQGFRSASAQLAALLPNIEGAAEGYARAREALDRSAEALLAGTDGYLKAGDVVKEMVTELRQVQSGQTATTADWKQSVETIAVLISDLTTVASSAKSATASMASVMEPAAQTAETFQSASAQLAAVLPSIEGVAGSYMDAQSALDASTAALQDGAKGYQDASVIVQGLVSSLQQVQSDQGSALDGWRSSVESMNALIGDLGGAASAVRDSVGQLSGVLPPMTTAAGTFLEASDRLSIVLPGIEGAAKSYDRSREALDTASRTLITSTKGYQDAGETVQQMLSELRATHIQAIERISAGVDEALLSSMRSAGDQLMTFNRHQQASLTLWQTSADQLSDVMSSMKQTAGDLTKVAGRLEQTTAPTLTASRSFQAAAEALSEVMPRIEDSARSNAEIRVTLESAGAAILKGTSGYQEAGASLERMVNALESQHTAALARAAKGLKTVLSDPMDAAGARLEGALTAQTALLAAWQQALAQFTPAISQLNQSTTGLSSLAGKFHDAALPASDAAKSFQDAARRLTTLFPQLESSADGYDKVNQALATAAIELTNAGHSYASSGEKMEALHKELQHTLKLQVLGTREFNGAMDKATIFVDTIGPASERVERAAAGLHEAAEKTTAVVRTVQSTVEIQDGAIVQMKDTATSVVDALKHQASHWGHFLSEMSRLESVLQSSVQTLSSELPHSIDHTLVHFDAALGEGVARIGSAIERLREAMDDLNERLEGMLADESRRR